jgi:putative ABC transport system ATP-binding protein
MVRGQRAAGARALVTDPRVLFADEPTGALDSLSGERVMGLLTEAARSTNAAVVLVTHEARVAAYSDRAIVVHDGRSRDMECVV